MQTYPVQIEPDGDTFLATSPDFPELTTFGETREEALSYAGAAIEEAIAARIAESEDIPPPSKGYECVTLPTMIALKAALYQNMRKQNVNKGDLAERIGCRVPAVDKLLSLDHSTSFDRMDAAFKALNCRISVSAALAVNICTNPDIV